MADVKTKRGGDILDDFVGKRAAEKLRQTQTVAECEEELRVKEDIRKNPPKPRRESLASPTGFVAFSDELGAEISSFVERAEALFERSGLTDEVIALIWAECCPTIKGQRHKMTPAHLQTAIEGLRNMREFSLRGSR